MLLLPCHSWRCMWRSPHLRPALALLMLHEGKLENSELALALAGCLRRCDALSARRQRQRKMGSSCFALLFTACCPCQLPPQGDVSCSRAANKAKEHLLQQKKSANFQQKTPDIQVMELYPLSLENCRK